MGDKRSYEAARDRWFTCLSSKDLGTQTKMMAAYVAAWAGAIARTQHATIFKGIGWTLLNFKSGIGKTVSDTIGESRGTWDDLEAWFNRDAASRSC